MTLENPCEFIKKIYQNPFAKVTDISVRDMQLLQEHLTTCQECDKLVEEIWTKYKDVPQDTKTNDGRWN